MEHKVFSGINQLPHGTARGPVQDGCLVLEGGAFRGLYTSGVLDAWMQEGIHLQCTVGVSAGALNGMNYVARQIGRSARVNLRYRHDSRYVGLKAYLENRGVIGFNFVLKEVQKYDPWNREAFYDPSRRFVAVATDCRTGLPAYFDRDTCQDIVQGIKASASMPYVSKMVDVCGVPCLDGGCSMKIPYDWAVKQGYQKIVIVRTRPIDYRREEQDPMAEMLSDRFYRKWPRLSASLKESNRFYNRQCDEIEKMSAEGKAFVLYPSMSIPVNRLEGDMEKLGKLYYLGYRDGLRTAEKLKKYLAE